MNGAGTVFENSYLIQEHQAERANLKPAIFFFLKPQNPLAGSFLLQGHVPNPSQVLPIPEE